VSHVAHDRMRRFRSAAVSETSRCNVGDNQSPAVSQAPEDRRLLRLVPKTGHSCAPERGFGDCRLYGARDPQQSGARRRSPGRCRDIGRAAHSANNIEAPFVSIRVHQWLNRNSLVLMRAQRRSSYFCWRAFASAMGLPWASVRGAARNSWAILSSLASGLRAKAAR